jgi:two-component system catabolic regulation response regulator CreB/two-component system response regulator ChvI
MKKILIIDDEPDITFVLKKALQENGFGHVDTFNDPLDVISIYKQQGMYNLIIIDILMPKMDGFKLYEKIKKIDGLVKVCFITAYDIYFEALKEIFPGSEVDCFMKKPVRNEELLRKVTSAITMSKTA